MASRRGLAIDGVLLLDKPEGLSSNHALQRARRILNAKKAGHTGTLDPFATGLMVLCFGEATKFSAGMFEADKTYVATLQFGVETDSGDDTGKVIGGHQAARYPWLDEPAALHEVLSRFCGRITQIPPMYSALKRDGKPLYHYARQGIELEREPREVTIHDIRLLACDADDGQITLEISCSKGTYIRTLAQDIGRATGAGAHLIALRRTRTAGFTLEQALTLEALEAMAEPTQALLAVDRLLVDLPAHRLAPELAARFALGQTVPAAGELEIGDPVPGSRIRIYAPDNQFLGCARQQSGWLKPDRLMAFNKDTSS